jgi:hypothetical protein
MLLCKLIDLFQGVNFLQYLSVLLAKDWRVSPVLFMIDLAPCVTLAAPAILEML